VKSIRKARAQFECLNNPITRKRFAKAFSKQNTYLETDLEIFVSQTRQHTAASNDKIGPVDLVEEATGQGTEIAPKARQIDDGELGAGVRHLSAIEKEIMALSVRLPDVLAVDARARASINTMDVSQILEVWQRRQGSCCRVFVLNVGDCRGSSTQTRSFCTRVVFI